MLLCAWISNISFKVVFNRLKRAGGSHSSPLRHQNNYKGLSYDSPLIFHEPIIPDGQKRNDRMPPGQAQL